MTARVLTSAQFVFLAMRDKEFVGNLDYVRPNTQHECWVIEAETGMPPLIRCHVLVMITGQDQPVSAMLNMPRAQYEELPEWGQPICGNVISACICDLAPGHELPHRCGGSSVYSDDGKCHSEWNDNNDENMITWPDGSKSRAQAMAVLNRKIMEEMLAAAGINIRR